MGQRVDLSNLQLAQQADQTQRQARSQMAQQADQTQIYKWDNEWTYPISNWHNKLIKLKDKPDQEKLAAAASEYQQLTPDQAKVYKKKLNNNLNTLV